MLLLNDDDFEDLPDNPQDAFIYLEAICRNRLHEAGTNQHGEPPYAPTLEYMNKIAAIAAHYGIAGLLPPDGEDYRSEFEIFTRRVDYATTQLKLARAARRRAHSLEISANARVKIQHHVERLKQIVTESDLPEDRKRSMLNRLKDFEAELSKKRISLAEVMIIIAAVTTSVHEFQSILTDAPKSIGAIMALIGQEKVEEEARQATLPKREPPRALPPSAKPKPTSFDSDLDDDVPF